MGIERDHVGNIICIRADADYPHLTFGQNAELQGMIVRLNSLAKELAEAGIVLGLGRYGDAWMFRFTKADAQP